MNVSEYISKCLV